MNDLTAITNTAFENSFLAEDRPRRGWPTRILRGFGTFLCVVLALFSYRWFLPFGFRPPAILANALAKPWLYVHIAGAATALLIAPLQFLPSLRRKGRPWHRWIGRGYVSACLVGGAAGLVAAFGSTAGPIAVSGFALLAVVYLAVNVIGWLRATQRRFVEHRRWMIYSFALTSAAITLRLELQLFGLMHMSLTDAYRAAAWISWTGNLAVAELYLRGAFTRRVPSVAAYSA